MNKSLIMCGSALALVLAATSAFSADLPSRKAPPIPPPPPVGSWTGFYLGVNHGFGGGVVDANVGLLGVGIVTGATTTNRAEGFAGGVDAGYQYQFQNNLVVGLETDMQWTDLKAKHQATSIASTGVAGFSYADIDNHLQWFGTTRARVGYSFGQLLPYVTGGVAYGGNSAKGLLIASGAVLAGNNSQTTVGWAAGAGLEYALTSNLSTRIEYLYVQLPGVTGPAAGFAPLASPLLLGSFSTGAFGSHLIRTGLNWKFDSWALPSTGNCLALLTAPATVDWSGFYVGANGGYGGNVANAEVVLASTLPLASDTTTRNRTSGFQFGGGGGYNYRWSEHIFLGLETDAQWSGVRSSHQALVGPAALTDIGNGLDWFGTTRARVGWATGPTLTYATGGIAYGDIFARGLQVSGGVFSGATSQTKIGWTVGGGTEYALTPNLSLKAEYLYVDFSGVSGSVVGFIPPAAPVVGAFRTGTFVTHMTRLGLNWRFNAAPAAPVLAKY